MSAPQLGCADRVRVAAVVCLRLPHELRLVLLRWVVGQLGGAARHRERGDRLVTMQPAAFGRGECEPQPWADGEITSHSQTRVPPVQSIRRLMPSQLRWPTRGLHRRGAEPPAIGTGVGRVDRGRRTEGRQELPTHLLQIPDGIGFGVHVALEQPGRQSRIELRHGMETQRAQQAVQRRARGVDAHLVRPAVVAGPVPTRKLGAAAAERQPHIGQEGVDRVRRRGHHRQAIPYGRRRANAAACTRSASRAPHREVGQVVGVGGGPAVKRCRQSEGIAEAPQRAPSSGPAWVSSATARPTAASSDASSPARSAPIADLLLRLPPVEVGPGCFGPLGLRFAERARHQLTTGRRARLPLQSARDLGYGFALLARVDEEFRQVQPQRHVIWCGVHGGPQAADQPTVTGGHGDRTDRRDERPARGGNLAEPL